MCRVCSETRPKKRWKNNGFLTIPVSEASWKCKNVNAAQGITAIPDFACWSWQTFGIMIDARFITPFWAFGSGIYRKFRFPEGRFWGDLIDHFVVAKSLQNHVDFKKRYKTQWILINLVLSVDVIDELSIHDLWYFFASSPRGSECSRSRQVCDHIEHFVIAKSHQFHKMIQKPIDFQRFLFMGQLKSIEHIHRVHVDNAAVETRKCGYSPGFRHILHFRWRRRGGIRIAVLRLLGVHNAEVASISENATKTNWFLTIWGLMTASNRSQVGQLQIWKSYCRSGNSHIFGLQRVIFIMLSDALLRGGHPGRRPRIGPPNWPTLVPLGMPIGSFRGQVRSGRTRTVACSQALVDANTRCACPLWYHCCRHRRRYERVLGQTHNGATTNFKGPSVSAKRLK